MSNHSQSAQDDALMKALIWGSLVLRQLVERSIMALTCKSDRDEYEGAADD